ncbi:thiamine phosphate synthase [Clostridium sp. JN-1]|uniref:thiamine phosphate synthase n=1 Tax=Clostridium sp. JN-1 TaxID=2483110 RepID=UPI000F0B8554|nr:thiamine phosphate synthase [Clostridium sp. JN-1]
MGKKLYMVTNRKLAPPKKLFHIIDEAVLGGIDAIILREKDLNCNQIIQIGNEIRRITEIRNTPLIVNGNLDAALKLNAEGFQTSYENYMNSGIKFKGIIGVSVHSTTEAVNAYKKGASYLLAGHVFETNCKKGLKGRGISFLEDILSKVTIPVIAIGGINEDNIDSVLKTGVSGAAVMSLIMTSSDPFITTNNLKKHFKEVKTEECKC